MYKGKDPPVCVTGASVPRTRAPIQGKGSTCTRSVSVHLSNQHKLSTSEIRDRLTGVFDRDPADPSWTPAEEATLVQKLNADLPEGSSVLSVECREQMCRVESAHRSLRAYNQYMRAAYMDPATQVWNAPGFSARIDDGVPTDAMRWVTFVARPKHSLPSVAD